MGRPPRIHVPGGCYHVTLRGNHREALFDSHEDRDKLDRIVVDGLVRFDVRLHAFCWMTNHLHALVQVDEQPLDGFVKSVASRFARYRHKSLGTSGHLFERRHGARLVAADSYFLTVLRYIHLNPVSAQIAPSAAAYRWSSHRAYLGSQQPEWVTTDLGLSLFSSDPSQARRLYAEFVAGGPDDDGEHCPAPPDDTGSPGANPSTGTVKAAIRHNSNRPDLDSLARQICTAHGISVELLRSRASRHGLTPIRLELLETARRQGIATLSGVARYLDRDPSTLSKQLSRLESPGREKPKSPKIQ